MGFYAHDDFWVRTDGGRLYRPTSMDTLAGLLYLHIGAWRESICELFGSAGEMANRHKGRERIASRQLRQGGERNGGNQVVV